MQEASCGANLRQHLFVWVTSHRLTRGNRVSRQPPTLSRQFRLFSSPVMCFRTYSTCIDKYLRRRKSFCGTNQIQRIWTRVIMYAPSGPSSFVLCSTIVFLKYLGSCQLFLSSVCVCISIKTLNFYDISITSWHCGREFTKKPSIEFNCKPIRLPSALWTIFRSKLTHKNYSSIQTFIASVKMMWWILLKCLSWYVKKLIIVWIVTMKTIEKSRGHIISAIKSKGHIISAINHQEY